MNVPWRIQRLRVAMIQLRQDLSRHSAGNPGCRSVSEIQADRTVQLHCAGQGPRGSAKSMIRLPASVAPAFMKSRRSRVNDGD
jgi:hypothetical protein